MPDITPTTPTLTEETNTQSDYQTIGAFISDSQLMLNNTKADATIFAKMTAAGYPVATIDGILSDLDQLRTYNEQQAAEYGEQFAATDAWRQSRDDYHPNYIDHLDLARIVFRKDPSAQNALGLNEKRAKAQANYIDQGRKFYDNAIAIENFKTALAAKGINLTTLQAGKDVFTNLQTLRQQQQKETMEAQKATQLRDELYDELEEWAMEYRATAKVVLRTNPQLMEAIGIKQTS